jgi:hypothetical protein
VGKHETSYARVARDLYPTRERWVTEALLAYIDLAERNVWEPAAGMGDMAEVLKAGGAHVFCSDIAEYGYPLDARRDFTHGDPGPFDAIITNPPQGPRNATEEAFIAAGLRYLADAGNGLLALLLPTDFDAAGRRRGLFADCPWFAAKIVLTRRIVWFARSDGVREAPKENHAWFVWERTALRARVPPLTLYAPAVVTNGGPPWPRSCNSTKTASPTKITTASPRSSNSP